MVKLKSPKVRNGGTWTEAQYWAAIRSGLRRLFRFNWEPAKQALLASRRPYTGPNKQQRWEHQCANCKEWFIRRDVELDHIEPCGSLRGLADIGDFLKRLHPESITAYQVLCKHKCHREKTAQEREARKII